MADGGRSNTGLAFIVGGLVVAVGILAYLIFGEGVFVTGGGETTNIEIETPDTGSGEAAGGGEGGAEGSAGESAY